MMVFIYALYKLNTDMQEYFVRILCDVHCDWTGDPPIYRAYINEELFTERTWIWQEQYLEEAFQIKAAPGKYKILYELLDPTSAQIRAVNFRVDWGPAKILTGSEFIILEESDAY